MFSRKTGRVIANRHKSPPVSSTCSQSPAQSPKTSKLTKLNKLSKPSKPNPRNSRSPRRSFRRCPKPPKKPNLHPPPSRHVFKPCTPALTASPLTPPQHPLRNPVAARVIPFLPPKTNPAPSAPARNTSSAPPRKRCRSSLKQ